MTYRLPLLFAPPYSMIRPVMSVPESSGPMVTPSQLAEVDSTSSVADSRTSWPGGASMIRRPPALFAILSSAETPKYISTVGSMTSSVFGPSSTVTVALFATL